MLNSRCVGRYEQGTYSKKKICLTPCRRQDFVQASICCSSMIFVSRCLIGKGYAVVVRFLTATVSILPLPFLLASGKGSAELELGNIVPGVFTPVLAKHSKSFSLIDCIWSASIGCSGSSNRSGNRWRPGREVSRGAVAGLQSAKHESRKSPGAESGTAKRTGTVAGGRIAQRADLRIQPADREDCQGKLSAGSAAGTGHFMKTTLAPFGLSMTQVAGVEAWRD